MTEQRAAGSACSGQLSYGRFNSERRVVDGCSRAAAGRRGGPYGPHRPPPRVPVGLPHPRAIPRPPEAGRDWVPVGGTRPRGPARPPLVSKPRSPPALPVLPAPSWRAYFRGARPMQPSVAMSNSALGTWHRGAFNLPCGAGVTRPFEHRAVVSAHQASAPGYRALAEAPDNCEQALGHASRCNVSLAR